MYTCNNSCSWAHLTALLGAHLCKTSSRKEVSTLNTYSKGWFKVHSLSQTWLSALGISFLLVKETIKGTSHLTNLILIGNTTQTWYSSGYVGWMLHLLHRPQSQELIKVNSYNANIRVWTALVSRPGWSCLLIPNPLEYTCTWMFLLTLYLPDTEDEGGCE